jgi:hypothetical protein
MFWGHFVLYIAGPIWAFSRGRYVLAGLAMLLASLMPIAGQVWFTDSDSPALGLLLLFEAPLAFVAIALGLAFHISRWLGRP